MAERDSYELFGQISGKPGSNGCTEGSVFSILLDEAGSLWVGCDKIDVGLLNRATSTIEGVHGLAVRREED